MSKDPLHNGRQLDPTVHLIEQEVRPALFEPATMSYDWRSDLRARLAPFGYLIVCCTLSEVCWRVVEGCTLHGFFRFVGGCNSHENEMVKRGGCR